MAEVCSGQLRAACTVEGRESREEKDTQLRRAVQVCVQSLLQGWTCDERRKKFAVAEGPFLACVLMYLHCFVCLHVHKTLCI